MNKNKKADTDPQTQDPFLEYLRYLPLSISPTSYQQLANGVILSQAFRLISGFRLSETHQEPRSFAHRFANYKALVQSAEEYWNSELRAEMEPGDLDIYQAAQGCSQKDLELLVELLIKTAAQSANKDFFIERILSTTPGTQLFLKQIVEKALTAPTQSPRKQKEKRFISRLLELDHQNDKLQQLIGSLCEEKEDLETRLKAASEQLAEKNDEIIKLRTFLDDQPFTPQKTRRGQLPDTIDRKDSQIESLSQQLGEAQAAHRRDVQEYLQQIQRLSEKVQCFEKIKAELQLAQSTIASSRQIQYEAQQLELLVSQQRAELMSRDNALKVLRNCNEKQQFNIAELEATQISLRSELEKKQQQYLQLIAAGTEKGSPRQPKGQNSLYLDFPEIANTEVEAYIETNRTLREELERTRTLLQRTSAELERTSIEVQQLRKCEGENRKLREMLIEEKAYKGEQIDVLLHTLYRLQCRLNQQAGKGQ